jgi:signal peptidase I
MDGRDDPGTLATARASARPPERTGVTGAAWSAQPSARTRGRGRHAVGAHHSGPAHRLGSGNGGGGGHRAARRRKNFWRELLIIVVAAAVLTLLIKAFVVQVYRIPSASMENTLQVGDRVLVNRLVYHVRSIDRGDIIVFSGQDSWGPDAPPASGDPVVRFYDAVLSDIGLASSQTYYIKRVIGLPGDHVACCNAEGQVTVNGVALNEQSYLYPGDAPSSFKFSVTVPPGHLWVMGDHRGDSEDSRYHLSDPGGGAIPVNEVVGRAFLIIWPPSQLRDLPIPATFDQAALHAGAAGATLQVSAAAVRVGGAALGAVAAAPVPGVAGAAGIIGAPLLLARRRRRDRSERRSR